MMKSSIILRVISCHSLILSYKLPKISQRLFQVSRRHGSNSFGKETFLMLGIETSCDDTGVSVMRSDGTILSNVVYSQHKIHSQFGGVVPNLAMHEHKKFIDIALNEALKNAGVSSLHDINGIAVTRGPGLEICLRVGLRKAQEIAKAFNKPLFPVHHLEAHCMIARVAGADITLPGSETNISDTLISSTSESSLAIPKAHLFKENLNLLFEPKISFPFLTLLVSGGHTLLMICYDLGKFEIIGQSLDDSLGEAFDKAARIVGLTCDFAGGGPAVEKAAAKGDFHSYSRLMSVPLLHHINCDFSFSGLKNSFRTLVDKVKIEQGIPIGSNAPAASNEKSPELIKFPENITNNLCASFQHVAFQHIELRVKRALQYVLDRNIPIRSLAVVGGVAANSELRRRLQSIVSHVNKNNNSTAVPLVESDQWRLIFPPPKLCTDNGAMIAWTGIEKMFRLRRDGKEHASNEEDMTSQEYDVIARWPLAKDGEGIDNSVFRRNRELL